LPGNLNQRHQPDIGMAGGNGIRASAGQSEGQVDVFAPTLV